MTDYRLILFDRRGRAVACVDLEYDSDEDAVAEVARHLGAGAAELWSRDVLVRAFPRMDDER
jgi:hypothetical protein